MAEVKLSRVWAMPSHETFTIKPINELVSRYVQIDLIDRDKGKWIDPFARNSVFKNCCVYTNDLDATIKCTHNMDALDFLKQFADNEFDGILFDPPYSPRQIMEQYKASGKNEYDTSNAFYSDRKDEAARLIKNGGYAICFGWTSGGFGKKNGFELIEVLLVCHGGNHNDTIVTVERKA